MSELTIIEQLTRNTLLQMLSIQ